MDSNRAKRNSFSSIKNFFLKFFVLIFIISSLLILTVVYYTLNNKTQEIGKDFAIQYALKEKHRILAPIQREVSLSKKMADSPLFIEWAKNEDNPFLRQIALQELESFRRNFADNQFFFVIDKSKHYYFNNKKNEYQGKELIYTLEESDPTEKWYFSTMKKVDDFVINVDRNATLDETNIWINTIIRDGDQKLGLAGTGLNLANYLDQFIRNENENITPMIFNRQGAIQAYKDLELIDKNSVAKEASEKSTIFKLINSKNDLERLKVTMDQLNKDDSLVKTMEISFNGHKNIAAITYLPEVDWYVFILFQLSDLYSIWDYKNIIIIMLVSLVLFIGLTIYFTNRVILNPLGQLAQSTHEMAAGNYHHKLDIENNNEIGELATSFNYMAETVEKYTHNLEQLVEERTKELRSANASLAEKNQEITDSILYAQNIQNSILPESTQLDEVFENYFLIWRPRDIVGGDFYWCQEVEDHYYFAVVDCTGHGVPGALMAMTANAILLRIIDNEPNIEPATLLSKLNVLLKHTLYHNTTDKEVNDGLDIALCKINLKNRKLVFAGTKLSLFYMKENQLMRVKGDRQSIGYRRSSESFAYTNHEVEIKPETTFYITTDGYLDQIGGEKINRIGIRGFTGLIEESAQKDLNVQGDIFNTTLDLHMGDLDQRDDITVVGFKIHC